MHTILLALSLLSTNANAEEELYGYQQATWMESLNFLGFGLVGGSVFAGVVATRPTTSGIVNIGAALATVGLFTSGSALIGVGTGLGFMGNSNMIQDLEYRNIEVDTRFFTYAKVSMVAAIGQLWTGYFMYRTSESPTLSTTIMFTSPFWTLPITYFLHKQQKVSVSKFENSKSITKSSSIPTIDISLVPSWNGFALVGTF